MKTINSFSLLPIINEKRFIEMRNVKHSEAHEFLYNQTTKLWSQSIIVFDFITKFKADPHFIHFDIYQTFYNVIDFSNITCEKVNVVVFKKLKELTCLSVDGVKYKRAIFIDIDENMIAFGKTLFGNDIGYINYTDQTLKNILHDIQLYIDNSSCQDIL